MSKNSRITYGKNNYEKTVLKKTYKQSDVGNPLIFVSIIVPSLRSSDPWLPGWISRRSAMFDTEAVYVKWGLNQIKTEVNQLYTNNSWGCQLYTNNSYYFHYTPMYPLVN